jgi:hypothetical protein
MRSPGTTSRISAAATIACSIPHDAKSRSSTVARRGTRRRTVARRCVTSLLYECLHTVADSRESMNHGFRRFSRADAHRQIDVAGQPRLGPRGDGQATDECEPCTDQLEVGAGTRDRFDQRCRRATPRRGRARRRARRRGVRVAIALPRFRWRRATMSDARATAVDATWPHRAAAARLRSAHRRFASYVPPA